MKAQFDAAHLATLCEVGNSKPKQVICRQTARRGRRHAMPTAGHLATAK